MSATPPSEARTRTAGAARLVAETVRRMRLGTGLGYEGERLKAVDAALAAAEGAMRDAIGLLEFDEPLPDEELRAAISAASELERIRREAS